MTTQRRRRECKRYGKPVTAPENRHRSVLVAVALFAQALVASAAEPVLSRTVGFYHWGGQYTKSLSQGIEQIAQLGGKVARITLSARYYSDYNLGGGCIPNFSLSDLAEEPDVKKALGNKQIEVFILTAYDGVTFGDCIRHRYFEPGFYTPSNLAAIVTEYSDFTLYLYETYRRTHKRFIISNWESDNDVYCGTAYAYATDVTVRTACDLDYPAAYGGNRSPAESFEGLRLWFQARQQGIEDGRRRARCLGIGGISVFFAPEFLIVHALRAAGFKSTLYDVLPFVSFDYVSYSSYESIGGLDPDKTLIADLNTIQDVVGSNAIILGEVGVGRSIWGNEATVARTDLVLKAALSWGVSFIVQWNLYDQSPQSDFGLFDLAGHITALGLYYQEKLLISNP